MAGVFCIDLKNSFLILVGNYKFIVFHKVTRT